MSEIKDAIDTSRKLIAEYDNKFIPTPITDDNINDFNSNNDDPVNHPSHYTSHPSGVECITIAQHFSFNVGNAIKYLWRAGLKVNHSDLATSQPSEYDDVKRAATLTDLRKAEFYIKSEIVRLERLSAK